MLKTFKRIISNFKWIIENAESQNIKKKITLDLKKSIVIFILKNLITISIPSIVISILNKKLGLGVNCLSFIVINVTVGLILWLDSIVSTESYWDNVACRVKFQIKDGVGYIHLPYIKQSSNTIQNQRDKSYHYIYENDDNGIGLYIPALTKTIQNFIFIILICLVVIKLSYLFSLFILATSSLSIFILNLYSHRRSNIQNKVANLYPERNYLMDISFDISSGQDIRMFNFNKVINEKIEKNSNKISFLNRQMTKYSIRYQLIISLIFLIKNVVLYSTLVLLIYKHVINITEFTFYFMAFEMLGNFEKEVSDNFEKLVNASDDIDKGKGYFNIVNSNSENKYNHKIVKRTKIHKIESIEFKNVSIKYPNSTQNVLNAISFKLKKHEKIALVGMNGAGKTTIVLALLRIIPIDDGQILVNGIDINEYDLNEYRNAFAPSFQENIIIADTIKNNITVFQKQKENYLKRDINLSGFNKVMTKRGYSLNQELTQYLDDNGINLSGGEEQKLMISRMLYRDSDVFIMDEPTAALDPIAEDEIYNNLNNLLSDKLGIFISHRLASTQFVDKILFLQNGKIISQGTHKHLLKNCPSYKKMFEEQSKYYSEQ